MAPIHIFFCLESNKLLIIVSGVHKQCTCILYLDLKRVIECVPHLSLKRSTASELRSNLKQQSPIEETADLHSILADYCDNTESKYPLFDLVSAMMLTEGIGRHVSRLVPFRKSSCGCLVVLG